MEPAAERKRPSPLDAMVASMQADMMELQYHMQAFMFSAVEYDEESHDVETDLFRAWRHSAGSELLRRTLLAKRTLDLVHIVAMRSRAALDSKALDSQMTTLIAKGKEVEFAIRGRITLEGVKELLDEDLPIIPMEVRGDVASLYPCHKSS